MDNNYLHTNKTVKKLSGIKSEIETLRLRRREIMWRLSEAGFTYRKIGEIYGCKHQYVEQEVNAYKEKYILQQATAS